jgi:hypothetical protein
MKILSTRSPQSHAAVRPQQSSATNTTTTTTCVIVFGCEQYERGGCNAIDSFESLFATGALSSREPFGLERSARHRDLVGSQIVRRRASRRCSPNCYELMPAGSGSSPADIVDLLRSPQFQQAVSQLSQALSGGELASLMLQVGLPMPSDAQLASNEPIQSVLARIH